MMTRLRSTYLHQSFINLASFLAHSLFILTPEYSVIGSKLTMDNKYGDEFRKHSLLRAIHSPSVSLSEEKFTTAPLYSLIRDGEFILDANNAQPIREAWIHSE